MHSNIPKAAAERPRPGFDWFALELTQQVDEEALARIALIGEILGEIRHAITNPNLHVVAQMAINRGKSAEALASRKIIAEIVAFDNEIPLLHRTPIQTRHPEMGVA